MILIAIKGCRIVKIAPKRPDTQALQERHNNLEALRSQKTSIPSLPEVAIISLSNVAIGLDCCNASMT